MKATWNIGLNNNPKTTEQIIMTFKVNFFNDIVLFREDMGEYKESPEPTLIVEVLTEGVFFEGAVIDLTEEMCDVYTQESIAVKIDGEGHLVYNRNFEGEKYEFDEQYFLPFEQEVEGKFYKKREGRWIARRISTGEVINMYSESGEIIDPSDVELIQSAGVEEEETEIDKAFKIISEAGYSTANMWHISDVQNLFKCNDEMAKTILARAICDIGSIEQIWFVLKKEAEREGLDEIEVN